ncbi:HTH-type transcriptional repressor KstR2 [compost metagenome]
MRAPVSRRTLNKQLTREAIFEAAMVLFGAQGYEATTVEEIAQAAGVSKGTFFNYFPTKDAILAHISVRHLERLLDEQEAVLAGCQTARERLKRLFGTLVSRFVADTRDIKVSIALTHQRYGREIAPHPAEVAFSKLVVRLLHEGLAAEELRADLDPVEVFRLVMALYSGTMVVWGQVPEAELPRIVQENLDRLFEGLERPAS